MNAGRPGREPRHNDAALRLDEQYIALRGVLHRYLRSMVGGAADDVASQVWTEATAGFERFSGDADAFRRWLFTIARRRVIDHRRRWWQRRVVLRGTPPEQWAESAAEPAAGDLGAALALIGRLPRSHAEIVLLRVIADFSAADVAQITGRSPESVRVMQHRALSTLASILAAEVNDA
ncbi:MAG: polymerase sigma-70 factor, subfamily [Gaiellales bacterium]|nr:polymerase sigma-70 factor, subfamily [Gaiellales bacterium]